MYYLFLFFRLNLWVVLSSFVWSYALLASQQPRVQTVRSRLPMNLRVQKPTTKPESDGRGNCADRTVWSVAESIRSAPSTMLMTVWWPLKIILLWHHLFLLFYHTELMTWDKAHINFPLFQAKKSNVWNPKEQLLSSRDKRSLPLTLLFRWPKV